MDPIDTLIDGAIQHEVLLNRNPYLTMETIILRLYQKISVKTGVTHNQCDKTILFYKWHDEILKSYQSIKPNVNQEEKAVIERVLSKDCPYPSELTKFACCWYKHDPKTVNKWFAVDGIIGTHPKVYVQDAFSTKFEKHNSAIRALYDYYADPEIIKIIVCKALGIPQEEKDCEICPTDIDMCVGIYIEMIGEDELERMALDRKSKLQAQNQPKQPNKRSKKNNNDSQQLVSQDLPDVKTEDVESQHKETTEETVAKKLNIRHPIKRKNGGDKTNIPVIKHKKKIGTDSSSSKIHKEPAKTHSRSPSPDYIKSRSPSPPFSPCYSPESSPPQSPQQEGVVF